MRGGAGDDVITAGAMGYAGGGDGDDTLHAGAGAGGEIVDGGAGDDLLRGGTGGEIVMPEAYREGSAGRTTPVASRADMAASPGEPDVTDG
ncbi:hypothetical protein SVIOM74S_04504 [Streptomyces violarus]